MLKYVALLLLALIVLRTVADIRNDWRNSWVRRLHKRGLLFPLIGAVIALAVVFLVYKYRWIIEGLWVGLNSRS